jgi:hypothetical protein
MHRLGEQVLNHYRQFRQNDLATIAMSYGDPEETFEEMGRHTDWLVQDSMRPWRIDHPNATADQTADAIEQRENEIVEELKRESLWAWFGDDPSEAVPYSSPLNMSPMTEHVMSAWSTMSDGATTEELDQLFPVPLRSSED